MLNKQLWVLALRAMIPVGVQNELRVEQVLLEDKGIYRINDHVVAAVHHESGLSDLLQVLKGVFRWSTPFGYCSHLCGSDLFVWQGIAIILPPPLPLEILPSRRLASFG